MWLVLLPSTFCQWGIVFLLQWTYHSRHHLGSGDQIFTHLGNCHPLQFLESCSFLYTLPDLWCSKSLSPEEKRCNSPPSIGTRPGTFRGRSLKALQQAIQYTKLQNPLHHTSAIRGQSLMLIMGTWSTQKMQPSKKTRSIYPEILSLASKIELRRCLQLVHVWTSSTN